MRFINFDNIVSENNENYINKSVFTPQHVSNTIIIGQTGSSKTNLLFNSINRYENYAKASLSSFLTSGKVIKHCNNQMIKY